jgi:hypothetical protein
MCTSFGQRAGSKAILVMTRLGGRIFSINVPMLQAQALRKTVVPVGMEFPL